MECICSISCKTTVVHVHSILQNSCNTAKDQVMFAISCQICNVMLFCLQSQFESAHLGLSVITCPIMKMDLP